MSTVKNIKINDKNHSHVNRKKNEVDWKVSIQIYTNM